MSTKFTRTSKTAYKRHGYSGPRKSLKRIRGGLRKFYNEESLSRLKVWRSVEMKKEPMNEEIVSFDTDNSKVYVPRTYTRVKSQNHLEASYSAPNNSTVTAESVVGQTSFIQVAQNESEIETLVAKLEPPEYYKSDLSEETEFKTEEMEIGEEGFS